MPQKHPVVKLGERFVSLLFPVSSHLEHLHYLQVILVVCEAMSIPHILFQHLELFWTLLKNLCVSEWVCVCVCVCVCVRERERTAKLYFLTSLVWAQIRKQWTQSSQWRANIMLCTLLHTHTLSGHSGRSHYYWCCAGCLLYHWFLL